jgi:Mrp family chromosome partitioning ATPase
MSGEGTGVAPTDELQLVARLLRRALRFWRIAAVVAILGALGTAGGAMLWPRTFTSQATLLYHEGLRFGQEEGSNPRRVGQRLSELLLSRTQLTSVVQELKLYPKLVAAGKLRDAVEEMRLSTKFRYDQGDVFVISYTGGSPAEAQRVAARLSEVLISEHQRLRSSQAEVTREFLDFETKRKTQELGDRQAALVAFLAKHPEFSVDQTTGVGVGIRARRERANEPVPVVIAPGGAEPAAAEHPLITARNAAEAKLTAARRDLAEKRGRFTDQHPEVRTALAAVSAAEEAFRKATEDARAVPPPPPPRPRALEPARPVRRGDGVSASRAVALETEWARLTREVAEAREQLQLLETQQFRASMAATMLGTGQTSQITVIDPAFLPTRPNGTRPRTLAALGVLLGIALGGVAAVIRALLDDVIYEPSDVERRASLPVLAVVSWGLTVKGSGKAEARADAPPRLLVSGREGANGAGSGHEPGTVTALARVQPTFSFAGKELHGIVRVHRPELAQRLDPRVVMLAAPDSTAAATFRQLRHRLEGIRRTRTVLVTSPKAREGKTTTAVNVALALGEGGRARVLLVEANFRAPELASLFGFEPPACISDQLQRHREDPTAPWDVVEAMVPWLHLLAVAPHNAGQPMLDALLLSICIDWLRNAGYDYVVVDCPGVLEGADVNLVEESVDGILIVLRAGNSRTAELRSAAGQVDRAKILGTVLVGS